MAQIDGHRQNDKKRNGGNFKPQGKKGAKKTKVKTGGHVNKYANAPRGPKPKKQRLGLEQALISGGEVPRRETSLDFYSRSWFR